MTRKISNGNAAAQRLTLRELEVFRSVIACGKTTAAAHQLGISQPAVSRALRQLEAHRGERLFRREGNGLVPTAEAFALNQQLEPVFDVLTRIAGPSERGQRRALVRIFAPATFSEHFLPRAIAQFLAAGDDCEIQLEIGSTVAAVASVASGLADLGVTNSPVTHSGVRLEPFRRSRACCVLPIGHPLAQREVIEPQDLRGEPFIALARRFASRAVIDRLFRQAGIDRRIVAESATAVAAAALVREGMGVSILNPFPISGSGSAAVVFRPFAPEIVYESSFMLPIAEVKPAARRFIDFVKSTQRADAFSTPVA